MTKRKSGFLVFCFSLLPGAGEMYLGYMKMGVSLMGMFFAIIAFSSMLNVGPILFLMPILWFYSFFHVHNLAGMSDMERVGVKDEFLFNLDKILEMDKKNIEKYRKVIAAALIIIGIIMLWNGFISICYTFLPDAFVRVLRHIGYTLPKMVVGTLIVFGGLYMIKGKKEKLNEVVIDVEAEASSATADDGKE